MVTTTTAMSLPFFIVVGSVVVMAIIIAVMSIIIVVIAMVAMMFITLVFPTMLLITMVITTVMMVVLGKHITSVLLAGCRWCFLEHHSTCGLFLSQLTTRFQPFLYTARITGH